MFWKIAGGLFALAVAACLAIAALPQAFGLEQAPVIAQVVSMRSGVIGIALALAALFALLLFAERARWFGGTIVAMLLVFSLVSGGIQVWRGFGGTDAFDVQDGDIVVLEWNTYGDAPGVDELTNIIRETGADIVTLPETTGELGTEAALRLREEGNPFWVHTTLYSPDYGALNTTLLISASLGEYTTDLEVGQTRTLPTIVARPDDGEGPVIVATHPVAPIPQQMRNWRADLEFVAGLCSSEPDIIMGGDFNSTIDHWASLGDGGDLGACTDAASHTGAGAAGTWPTWAPTWLGAPIDHVVASANWTPVASEVLTGYDEMGTDHRPLLVQLRPSG